MLLRYVANASSSVANVAAQRWKTTERATSLRMGAWLQLRFVSSATDTSGVRSIEFCMPYKSARYRPLKYAVPGVHLNDVLSSTAREMEVTINDPITTAFWVPRRVASYEPTALEERDGVYWPAETPLHELIREHGITPNPYGEVFVLAGPARIGDRALSFLMFRGFCCLN
jgi:hypothetical protein